MQSQQLWKSGKNEVGKSGKNECSHNNCGDEWNIAYIAYIAYSREAGKMNAVTTIVEMNGLVRRGRWQEPRV